MEKNHLMQEKKEKNKYFFEINLVEELKKNDTAVKNAIAGMPRIG